METVVNFFYLASNVSESDIVKIIKIIFDSNLVGVIVGAIIAYSISKLGKVKIEHVSFTKLFPEEAYNDGVKLNRDSFLIDVINGKTQHIYLNNMFIRRGEKMIPVYQYKIDTKNGEDFINIITDPINIEPNTAKRLSLYAEGKSLKEGDLLIIHVNGKKHKINIKEN